MKSERLPRSGRRAARGNPASGFLVLGGLAQGRHGVYSEPVGGLSARAHAGGFALLSRIESPYTGPQFLGLPSELTPARRIRPAAGSGSQPATGSEFPVCLARPQTPGNAEEHMEMLPARAAAQCKDYVKIFALRRRFKVSREGEMRRGEPVCSPW